MDAGRVLPGPDGQGADPHRVLLGTEPARRRRLRRGGRQADLFGNRDRAAGTAAFREVDDRRPRLRPVSALFRLRGQVEDLAPALLGQAPQAVRHCPEALRVRGGQRLVEEQGQRGPSLLGLDREGDPHREEELHPGAARELRQRAPLAGRGLPGPERSVAGRPHRELELVPGKAREPVLRLAENGGPARPDVLGLHLIEHEGTRLGQHRLVEAPVERVPRALAPGSGLLEVATPRREIDAGPDPRDRFREGRDPRRPFAQGLETAPQRGLAALLLDHPQEVGPTRERPVDQVVVDDPHLGKLPIERPPLVQELEPAAQPRLVAGLQAGAPEHLVDLRPTLLDLGRQALQVLPRRTEVTLGAVTLTDPAGQPFQAMPEHLRRRCLDVGRGRARRLARGRFDTGRFGDRRIGGGRSGRGRFGAGGPGVRDSGPAGLPVGGEERDDVGPQGPGLAFPGREPRPALAEREVGAVVVAGQPQPTVERGVERLGVEVHPARDLRESSAVAFERRAKILAPALRLPAAAEVFHVLAGRAELAVERMEPFDDLFPLPGLRPLDAAPAVSLLRLESLAGSDSGATKEAEDVHERDRGGSEEGVRGGMEEEACRDRPREPGRREHQQCTGARSRGTGHVRGRQPVQQLSPRLVDPFGVGRRLRHVGKAGKLGVELAKLGRELADPIESLVRGMDRLRTESDPLAGLAAELASRPVAGRFLLLRPVPHPRKLAFEMLQPGDPGPHVRGPALVERAPGKPGRGEGALGRAAIGFGLVEALLRPPTLAAQAFQRLGLGTGEALHVRRKRRNAPFELGPLPSLLEKPDRLLDEGCLAVRRLRLVELPLQGTEPFLVALQVTVPSLPVPEIRFGGRDLLRLRLPRPGRDGKAAFAAGGIKVVPAGHLAYQAPGDVGVGVGIAGQQVLDMEGVAGNEAVLRERRRLDPLSVPGPDEGAAGAGGLDEDLSRPVAVLLPVSRVLVPPLREREHGLDIDALAGELPPVQDRSHGSRNARLPGGIGSDDNVDPVREPVKLEAGTGDPRQAANGDPAKSHAGPPRWSRSSASAPSAARSSSSAASSSVGGARPCAAKARRPPSESRRRRAPARSACRSVSSADLRRRRTLRARRAGGSAPRASSSRSRAGPASIRQSCTKYRMSSRG